MIDAQTVFFALKRPWSDGTTHLLLSPEELIEKLAALVPPPRLNLVRYHGVLAPNAADRQQIVPGPREEERPVADDGAGTTGPRCYRLTWAVLLARVFRVDVTLCPDCGGRMKIIAALTDPKSIHSYLRGVGLPSRAPPIAPVRRRPQPEFDQVS